MESNVTDLYARQMAMSWLRALLPSQKMSYTDYLTVIGHLDLATNDPAFTAHIVTTVISQAKELGESSEWVEQEVRFETQVIFVAKKESLLFIRTGLLRVHLNESAGSDQGLDLYNIRLSRFADDEKYLTPNS